MDRHPDADSASTHTQSTEVVEPWAIHSRLEELNRLQMEVPIDVLTLPPDGCTCSSDAQPRIFVKHQGGNPVIEDLHSSRSLHWARIRVEVPSELSNSEPEPSVDVFCFRHKGMNASSKLDRDVLYFSLHTRSGLGESEWNSPGEESFSLDDGEICCSLRTRHNMDKLELQNLGHVPFSASMLPVSGAQADIGPGSSAFLPPGCWRIQAGPKFIEVNIEAGRRSDRQRMPKGWIGGVFEHPFRHLRKVLHGLGR